MKTFIQSEIAECGLACLAIVVSHYDDAVDYHSLKQKFKVSSSGSTLSNLSEIAEELGFSSRSMKVDIERISEVTMPCILHWQFSHFVVLERISKGKFIVVDPKIGRIKLSGSDFSNRYTGLLLELEHTTNYSSLGNLGKLSIFNLVGNSKPFLKSIWQIAVLALLFQVLSLISPLFLQEILDNAVYRTNLELLLMIGAGYLCVSILIVICQFFQSVLINSLGLSLSLSIKRSFYSHLFKLPFSFFSKHNIGEILNRISSISSIENILINLFLRGAVASVTVIVTFVFLLAYDWRLASLTMALSILATCGSMLFIPFVQQKRQSLLMSSASLATNVIETLRSIRIAKIYGDNHYFMSNISNSEIKQFNATVAVNKITAQEVAYTGLLSSVQRVAIVTLGGYFVMTSEISVGIFVAFLSYQLILDNNVNQIKDMFLGFKYIDVELSRLSDVLFTKPEMLIEGSKTHELESIKSIEAKNISFKFGDKEVFNLSRVNFRGDEGQFIVVLGPSGGGKSTLIELLSSFERPDSGRLLINGFDINSYNLKEYRSRIAVVSQFDNLVAGTISENISFFDPDANFEKIVLAAEAASIDDEIRSFPMGYSSYVGDMGNVFSGGQVQRIIIARLFYRDPDIIFFDEGTSNLDMHSELAIWQALKSHRSIKVIVSHSSRVLSYADVSYKMVSGKLRRL